MNILFIDNNNFQSLTRMELIRTHNHDVELAATLADVHIMYGKDKYDVIVMDNTIENGNEILEYLIGEDPQQRMLIVSNAIGKSDPQGCEHCVKTYNRRQLSNPTPIKNIIRMIEGFDKYSCDWYDAETSLTV